MKTTRTSASDASAKAPSLLAAVVGRSCVADRLAESLSELDEHTLGSISRSIGLRIDPAMRLAPALQVARAVTLLPEARDSDLLPPEVRRLVQALAQTRGRQHVAEVSSAARWLAERGLLFVRRAASGGALLSLPAAVRLQLKPWEGEDPRSARVLLWHANEDVKATIASHYQGRPATRPVSLPLEHALIALCDPERVAHDVRELPPSERKLLAQVEELGGEVDTAELLDLEREPMRLRTASGPTVARKGIGFALERRGFLIPLHPNRHIIPSEVARWIGAERHEARARNRQAILHFVLAEDHAPRRARFAHSPAPLALALALASREAEREFSADVTVPRSWITRWSTRLGQDAEVTALIVALGRAAGLWDEELSPDTHPGSCNSEQLDDLLFDVWYRGGVWNEAHPAGDPSRSGRGERGSGAIPVLRTLVLEALHELGADRWVPWEAIAGYLRTDERAAGLNRLVQRWAQRVGVEAQPIAEIGRRMVLQTLHALGVVDLGDAFDDDAEAELGAVLRVTPGGRQRLARVLGSHGDSLSPTGTTRSNASEVASEILAGHLLRVGSDTACARVCALAPFVEVHAVSPALELKLTSATLGAALARGLEPEVVEQCLAAVAVVPAATQRLLTRTGAVLGAGEFVDCQGFLRVEDNEVRELLLSKRQTCDLFLPQSPPTGLLIAPDAVFEQLVRRCRTVGVEVLRDGRVSRTLSSQPPPLQSGSVPRSGRVTSRPNARPRRASR